MYRWNIVILVKFRPFKIIKMLNLHRTFNTNKDINITQKLFRYETFTFVMRINNVLCCNGKLLRC